MVLPIAIAMTFCVDEAMAGKPIDPRSVFPASEQWKMIEAAPRLLIGKSGSASSVVIGQKDGSIYLLTAHHALDDAAELMLEFHSRSSYFTPARVIRTGVVVAKFPGPDLAVLRFASGDKEVPELKLCPWEQRPKRFPVDGLAIGCPGGLPPTCEAVVVQGRKLAQQSNDNYGFFWETNRIPVKGRSGGPLVDSHGRVIGICTATLAGRGYYTHLDEILAGLMESEQTRWLVELGEDREKTR